MKIQDLLEMRPVLQQVLDHKMPAKLAYAIAKNVRQVNSELEDFETTRIKLLKDNWELDPVTQQYTIPPEDQKKWQEMYRELTQAEVELKPFTVKQSMFDNLEITPGEMMALSWMIEEE